MLNHNNWPYTNPVDPAIYDTRTDWPKISIVTPSFNQGQFIEETILSILNQNYPNLEYIIIDGGSTDNTVEVIKKYEDRITYWISESDKGQAHAINKGFSLVTGDYYGWINSDDYYNKDAFFHLAQGITKSKRDFYYGNSDEILEDGTYHNFWFGRAVKNRFLRYSGLIASHTAFWSKDIHIPLLEYLNCAMDYELWIRLTKNASKKHINYTLATVRHHEMAKSHDKSLKVKWENDFELIKKHHNLVFDGFFANLRRLEFKYYQLIYEYFNKKNK